MRKNEAIHENDVARIESLNLELAASKERITELEDKLTKDQAGVQVNNQLELIKRISRLEQRVFKKD